MYINFVKYHFRVGTTVFLIDYFEIVSHVFCVTGDNDPCLTQSSSFLDRWERRIAHNYSHLHKTDHTRTLFVKWLWLISRTPHHNPSLYVKILTQKYFKIGQKINRKRQNLQRKYAKFHDRVTFMKMYRIGWKYTVHLDLRRCKIISII